MLDWEELIRLCGQVDIIVSERRLPPKCIPRWIKADRSFLEKSGGLAVTLGDKPSIEMGRGGRDDHPWVQTIKSAERAQYRRRSPANLP